MEDNENLNSGGKLNKYGGSDGEGNISLGQDEPTTALDWLGIAGMMGLVYICIIILWLICNKKNII